MSESDKEVVVISGREKLTDLVYTMHRNTGGGKPIEETAKRLGLTMDDLEPEPKVFLFGGMLDALYGKKGGQ